MNFNWQVGIVRVIRVDYMTARDIAVLLSLPDEGYPRGSSFGITADADPEFMRNVHLTQASVNRLQKAGLIS